MKGAVETHFNVVAKDYDSYKKKNSYYYSNLKKLLGSLIPQNKKVFEIGCGTGNLLFSLKPKIGYGMDISSEMVAIAKSKHKSQKKLMFSTIWPSYHFDYIFMSDVIEHLEDPKVEINKISRLMNKETVFICTMANPVWEPILIFWERMGWKMPEGKHKRIEYKELKIMVENLGLKIINHDYKLLIPIKIPILTNFINMYFEKPFRKYAFIEYFVAVRS